jgi:hypothetical protein
MIDDENRYFALNEETGVAETARAGDGPPSLVVLDWLSLLVRRTAPKQNSTDHEYPRHPVCFGIQPVWPCQQKLSPLGDPICQPDRFSETFWIVRLPCEILILSPPVSDLSGLIDATSKDGRSPWAARPPATANIRSMRDITPEPSSLTRFIRARVRKVHGRCLWNKDCS